jgi:hypothetical protein
LLSSRFSDVFIIKNKRSISTVFINYFNTFAYTHKQQFASTNAFRFDIPTSLIIAVLVLLLVLLLISPSLKIFYGGAKISVYIYVYDEQALLK